MSQRILIVEDEPSISELIAINLLHDAYVVDRAFQADEATQLIRQTMPDLIILDWMLPGKSGVQFAKELRANEATAMVPILMLTAKSEEADKVLGLDSGADDYMTKPFSTKELMARVKALLRRHSRAPSQDELMVLGAMRLDPVTHRVTAEWPNATRREIVVGPTEFRLLHFYKSLRIEHQQNDLLQLHPFLQLRLELNEHHIVLPILHFHQYQYPQTLHYCKQV